MRDQTERLYKEASVDGSTVNEEQVKKLKDKSDKAQNDTKIARDKYQEGLRDIGTYNQKYAEDMCHVFNKCQQSEEERKKVFKETLLSYCQQMSLSPHFNRLVEHVFIDCSIYFYCFNERHYLKIWDLKITFVLGPHYLAIPPS